MWTGRKKTEQTWKEISRDYGDYRVRRTEE